MTETVTPPAGEPATGSGAASAPEAPAGSFFSNLFDLYFAPRQAFARILRRPMILIAIAAYAAVSLAGTYVWMRQVDPGEFTRAQMEQFGGKRFEQMPAEAKAQAIDTQVRFFAVNRWVRAILGIPFILLIPAAVFLFIYRFFFAAEIRFVQSLAIVTWTALAVELVTTPLRLLVLWLKKDWTIEPQFAIQASPGAFVDPTTAKWMWGLLSIPDLFTIWFVFLLATGYSVVSKRPTGSTVWGVAIPWLILALVGVGMMAAFM